MKRISLCLTFLLLLPLAGNGQNSREPTRIAVVPFQDIPGSAGGSNTVFTQMLLSRLSREDRLFAKLVQPDKPTSVLDRETAVALGKKENASMVISGQVIKTLTTHGNSGLPIPKLGRVNRNSAKAEVQVEAELISVESGRTLALLKVDAKKNTSSGSTAINTPAGPVYVGNTPTANSPMGQAMSECAEKLVRKLLEVSKHR